MQQNFPEILVLRHGQTEWNKQHRMQGRLNSPLTQLGRDQARAQNKILRQMNLDGFEFYCSPQGRAVQTAEIALEGIADTITTRADLCEIDMDVWAGKTLDEVLSQKGIPQTDYAPLDIYNWIPNGEGLTGLFKRCDAFLKGLQRPSVLVTHGVTSRCLRVIAMGQTKQQLADIPGGQGVVHRVKDGIHSSF